jgi:SHS2 domain-containing protein
MKRKITANKKQANSKISRGGISYDKKYEFIDITTSDTAFIAYGRNLNELFENAALATFEVMVDLKNVRAKEPRQIDVTGHDLMALMFNWINELLVYVDSESLAFSKFGVRVDEKALRLRAVCKGERIDQKRHSIGTVVKSCTYHKMEIKKENGVWRAQVILDI